MLPHAQDLLRRTATERHRRQCVRIEEADRVCLVTATDLTALDVAEEECLPAVNDRRRVAVRVAVVECRQLADAGAQPGLLLEWRAYEGQWRGRVVRPVLEDGEWVAVEQWVDRELLGPS